MKTRIYIPLALALLTGVSFSQTTNLTTNPVVYMAGSQAFSRLDNAALASYARDNGYTLVATTGSSNVISAKAVLYVRTNNPTGTGRNLKATVDIINVHQTGSEAGMASAASGGKYKVGFLNNNARGLGLPDAATNYPNSNTVSITTSPIYQKNSWFFPKSKLGGFVASQLTEVLPTNGVQGIAVQSWVWSAGTNFPADLLNITSETAQALFRNGHVPLSFFTGKREDSTNGVWLMGRDLAAGARLAAQISAGYGALAGVRQYQLTNNGGSLALALTPALNVLGINQPAGNGGYNSTTSQQAAATNILPSVVRVDLSGSGSYTNSPYTGTNYLIQYNGYANSVGVTNSLGQPALVPMAFNGVPPTDDAIRSGAYTFWTYEHIYVTAKPTNASAIAKGIADFIFGLTTAQINGTVNSRGYYHVNDLDVLRTTDGGPVQRK